MNRSAERRACGCKRHETAAPTILASKSRGGLTVLRLRHDCGSEWNMVVVRGNGDE